MLNVYIEDLVANSFIAYLIHGNSINKTVYKLNLHQIEKFGHQIIKNLEQKNIPAQLIISKDLTEQFFQKYYEYFSLQDDDTVVLNEYVSLNNLIDTFTGYLSTDLIIEFGKRKNYKILFEKA